MAGKKGAISKKPSTVPRNGKPSDDYLRLLDGRKAMPRLMRAQLQEIYDDLGGHDRLSTMQRSLCQRFVCVSAWQGSVEAKIANGEKVDDVIGTWLQSINTALGLAKTLGLRRQAKDVTLKDYVKEKYSNDT